VTGSRRSGSFIVEASVEQDENGVRPVRLFGPTDRVKTRLNVRRKGCGAGLSGRSQISLAIRRPNGLTRLNRLDIAERPDSLA